MNKKIIGIAGMGWLGLPMAQQLQWLGYEVRGSVTTSEKAKMMQIGGLNAFTVEISENGIAGEINSFLNGIDILIIMIPPGIRRNTGSDYVLKMVHFLEHIKAANIPKVIFISSTSVYDDNQGAVTEKDIPKPSTENGRQLFQVEQLFFKSDFIETTIVRFGGLFGGNRNPVKYLAGRENLNGGYAPVNLIHRDDCIKILCEIIKQDAFGHIFNSVNPQHPSKKEYYIEKAKEMDLVPPTFSEVKGESVFKKVDSLTLKSILGFSFDTTL